MNNVKKCGGRTSLVIKPTTIIFPLLMRRLEQKRFLDKQTPEMKGLKRLLPDIILLKESFTPQSMSENQTNIYCFLILEV